MQSLYALKITTSNYCDFKCKYCYVDTDNTQVISTELLYQSIDYYLSQKDEHKTVFFLGWEALLQFDVLKKGIKRIRDNTRYDHVSIFITTSWLSLTQDKVDFLFNNNVKIGVSIDGNMDIHWRNRQTKNGKNTYLATMASIKILNTCYNESNSGYAMTVDENTVEDTFNSFLFLSNLDKNHRNITIAWVYKDSWKQENIVILENEIEKICQFIFLNITEGKFYYYNVLSFFILQKSQGNNMQEGNVELHIFPDWQVSKYLFAQSVLWNIWDDPTHGRFSFVNRFATAILHKSKTDTQFDKYLQQLSLKPIL
jgi:sulfatase maturation enzyme AslB (radical SAM superfamily)